MAHRIILDVDTGTDDAVALMVAALSPDIELVGFKDFHYRVGKADVMGVEAVFRPKPKK